jgi:hypothetical protein
MERDKLINESDPEISNTLFNTLEFLFNLLSGSEMVISKEVIASIINEYELPINLGEFFAPLGNKETIAFSDFCTLFRSKSPDNAIFFNTFTSSFHAGGRGAMAINDEDLFPVQVLPR